MFSKTTAIVASLLPLSVFASGSNLPEFISADDLKNPVFECLNASDATEAYTPAERKLIDQLWDETLTYLRAYAHAVTTDTTGRCRNSDTAVYETTDGIKSFCITDRRDVQLAVKHIHQILANPDKAKACFSPRRSDKSLTMPSGELLKKSPVAQWLKRTTLHDFFSNEIKNKEVQKYGLKFAENFDQMVLGEALHTPSQFGIDVTANALPNLWAAAGWLPMYAADSDRNRRNFMNVRGGYAYAEVMGHWGLLRIKSIYGVPVGAEIGMTVQQVGTLYPYHNHAISEMYYTLREPASINQLKSFAVRDSNPRVKTVGENKDYRKVEIDTSVPDEKSMWANTAWNFAPLVYFHENTIHAFQMDADGEKDPDSKAMVAVWARGNADDTRNDYGNTRLCENADQPDTPALRGGKIRCELTHMKW